MRKGLPRDPELNMEERSKLQPETLILREKEELALDDPQAWWIVESGSL